MTLVFAADLSVDLVRRSLGWGFGVEVRIRTGVRVRIRIGNVFGSLVRDVYDSHLFRAGRRPPTPDQ